METAVLLYLSLIRKDIIWIQKLRKASKKEKFAMMIKKCPACMQRIISHSFMLSDAEIAKELEMINVEIESLISKVQLPADL